MSGSKATRPLCLLCVLLGTLLVSGRALGQAQLRFEVLPDLTLRYASTDTEWGQWRLLGEAAASARAAGPAAFSRLPQGTAGLLLGFSPGPTDLFRARSQLHATSLGRATSLNGRHDLQARFGVGRLDEGTLGVDLELTVRFDHGHVGNSTVRTDLGAGDFADLEVRGTAWLRRGLAEVAALVFPIGYSVDVIWAQPTPVGGTGTRARTATLHAGAGLRDYMRYVYHGWLEIVGLSWGRTTSDGPIGPVDRINLRVLHLDDVVFRDVGVFGTDHEHLFAFSGHLGGTWLIGADRGRQLGLFTFAGSATARFAMGTEGLARAQLGVGLSRRAGHTPRGDRFTDVWRAEAHGALSVPEFGMGVELRAASEWQRDAEGEGGDRLPTVARGSVESEWWLQLLAGLELGASHHARHGTPLSLDGWRSDSRWHHELRLFLRWRGGHRGEERYSSGPAGWSRWTE